MLEYHANKDPAVAIRIFELGFKLFSEDADYVVRYLQFLLSINDDTSEPLAPTSVARLTRCRCPSAVRTIRIKDPR